MSLKVVLRILYLELNLYTLNNSANNSNNKILITDNLLLLANKNPMTALLYYLIYKNR